MFVSGKSSSSITIPVTLYPPNNTAFKIVETKVLIDSGATGCFIDYATVVACDIPTTRLKTPLRASNVDGTPNQNGLIRKKATIILRIGETTELRDFLVIDCGKDDVILGLPWLRDRNPEIDWSTGFVRMTDEEPTSQDSDADPTALRNGGREDLAALSHTITHFNRKCQVEKLRKRHVAWWRQNVDQDQWKRTTRLHLKVPDAEPTAQREEIPALIDCEEDDDEDEPTGPSIRKTTISTSLAQAQVLRSLL